MRDLALFLHLLGVLGLTSGIVLAAVAHARARRSADIGEVVALLRLARTGVLLAAPSALVVVGAGAWLVGIAGHLDWSTGWLRAAVALFVVSLLLGGAGGRRLRHARELAERLQASGGEPTRELGELLGDRPSQIANLASAAAMAGVLWLMVAKPSY